MTFAERVARRKFKAETPRPDTAGFATVFSVCLGALCAAGGSDALAR